MNKHKYNKTNQPLTPPLNLHFIQGRRSRALAQALPALNKERNRTSQKNAFTIIEVVLVLAIAGLIFLMVFIALPALQRNQRDTQRKQDMNKVLDAWERFRANNRGTFPRGDYDVVFRDIYLKNGDTFTDPDGSEYSFRNGLTADGGNAILPNMKEADGAKGIYVHWNYQCDGEDVERRASTSSWSMVAFRIRLEGGGLYCVSN